MSGRGEWKDWGEVFLHYLDKGMQHADAAYRADEWEKRKPKSGQVRAEIKTD